MSDDYVDRWFSEPDFGLDDQDVDLILADLKFLPRLRAYLDDPNSVDEKKVTVIMALLQLIRLRNANGVFLLRFFEVEQILKQHSEIAKRAIESVGLIEMAVIMKVLGIPVPPEYPKWVEQQADEIIHQ